MTLLQRLASVGLGRREGDDRPLQPPQPVRPLPQTAERAPLRPQPQPQPRPPEQRAPDPVSDYAKRQAPQGLDVHGRQTQAPAYKQVDDDQLDIPAFLRRQAN